MQQSEETGELFAALCKAQASIKAAPKSSENPHFQSKYADLSEVINSIRGPLADNGLSYIQEAIKCEGGVGVTTQINHSSGQWIRLGPTPIPVSKMNAHQVGSAVTYAKRYSLCAALGVATEDDDGTAATEEPERESKPERTERETTSEKVKSIIRSQCLCKTKSQAMELLDAATCGQFTIGEIDNEQKAKVILGILTSLSEHVPYREMMSRLDEVRGLSLDESVGSAIGL